MKKAIPSIYYIFLVIGIGLIIAAQIWAHTDRYNLSKVRDCTEMVPVQEEQAEDNTRKFLFELDEKDDSNSCMEFFTTNQDVWVFVDQELVYSVTAADSVFGRTTGAAWNFVELPLGSRQVIVRLQPNLPQADVQPIHFYQGNAFLMYRDLIRGSILEVIVSIIDILVGMLLIVYWIVVRRKLKIGLDILYFGIFATVLGCWSFNETEAATVLFLNRLACSWLAYVSLMLLVPPFILFVREFLEVDDKVWANVFCIASYLDMLFCIVFHITGLFAFQQTVIATHILMGSMLFYVVMALVKRAKQSGMDRKVRMTIAGITVLTISYAIDLIAYYVGLQKTDVVGRFGLLIFIVMLGYETAAESLSKVDEGRKAEIYRELALKDMLTGLYNRNAYDEWSSTHSRMHGVMLVMFDLNNLKECNDTMGHAMGDYYIKSAAEIIKKVYGEDGTCYRIGGDEFCAVISNAKQLVMDDKLNMLLRLEEVFNRNSQTLKMSIAQGYAIFDEKMDKNIEDTRKRADEMMYRDKRMGKLAEQGM